MSRSRPPPSQPVGPSRTNVVAPMTPFFGREADLGAIDDAIRDGARIVTVLGPAGMGKTRVLYRYAESRAGAFLAAGGVWFVDLTAARDVVDLFRAITAALSVRLRVDGPSAVTELARVLGERGPTLVLCDNFEGLSPAAAEALGALSAASPSTVMLVSSRRRLGLAGERVHELAPLAIPEQGALLRETETAEAVRLFVERARAAGHVVGEPELSVVASLVRELEGLPLAIELAAARMRVASPREILARLARGHDVLGGDAGARGAGVRSLKAANARSWDLLADWEASALAQLACFASEVPLAIAEAVVDLSAFPDAPPVLDVLASLRDQSLLARRVEDGETRVRMYASLRELARERLPESEAVAVRVRHRHVVVAHAFDVAERHYRTGEHALFRALERLREDLRAIARDLLGLGTRTAADEADLARVAFALEPSVAAGGNFAELLELLARGAAGAIVVGDTALAARLTIARGAALGVRGENERSIADLERGRELARAAEDRPAQAEALIMLSVRLRQESRLDDAIAAATEAGALVDADAWPRLYGESAVVKGMLLGEVGRADEARRENLRARAIFVAAGNSWSEALALVNLAALAQAAGDFEGAAHDLDQGLAIFRAFGDLRYESRYLGYRATVAHESGAHDEALALYQRALTRGVVLPHSDALWHAGIGVLHAGAGDLAAATDAFAAADASLSRVDAPLFAAAIEVHRGHLDVLAARSARAAESRAECMEKARTRLTRRRHDERSADVRFAARLLARAIEALDARPRDPSVPPRKDQREILWVGASGRAFRLGDSPTVDLSRRGSLRRILEWLASERLARPGVASDWPALLARGWPDERVLVEAGATRVRVAVATLRKLGLARVLVTRDDGYLLSESVDIRPLAEAGPSGV